MCFNFIKVEAGIQFFCWREYSTDLHRDTCSYIYTRLYSGCTYIQTIFLPPLQLLVTLLTCDFLMSVVPDSSEVNWVPSSGRRWMATGRFISNESTLME